MSGLPSWARVGAKVVCVDDSNQCWPWYAPEQDECVVKDGIYVIESAGIYFDFESGEDYVGLTVCGVRRVDGVRNVPFDISRFRPLVTLEDDITTYFAELLDVREPVEA